MNIFKVQNPNWMASSNLSTHLYYEINDFYNSVQKINKKVHKACVSKNMLKSVISSSDILR